MDKRGLRSLTKVWSGRGFCQHSPSIVESGPECETSECRESGLGSVPATVTARPQRGTSGCLWDIPATGSGLTVMLASSHVCSFLTAL